MPKVCIIIPFYNESNRIDEEAFHSFLAKETDYSLMLVDDGSSDSTLAELQKMKEVNPNQINVFSLNHNSGKAEAVRQGVLQALAWKEFDYFGYMDADLATPLSEAPYLASYLAEEQTQFVVGSRVKLYGWNINRSLKRHYFGRVFATYVGYLFKFDIYDTQCGAKFFTNEIAKSLFNDEFVSKWFFDIELLLRLHKKMGNEAYPKSLIEIPLHHWNEKGESKLKLCDFLKTPFELGRIRRKYR